MLAQDYPVTLLGDLVGCSRSSYCHQAKEPDETEIKAAIKAEAGEWPTYGYRWITAQLRRQGWVVNRKRVRRLMQELDIKAKIKRGSRRTTNSEQPFPRYPNLVQGLFTPKTVPSGTVIC